MSAANQPIVYLAGKISQSDWRHPLIPGLKGHHWDQGPIDAGEFLYTGPFFVACDHGCAHGKSTHAAVGSPLLDGCTPASLTRKEVYSNILQSLDASHLVFAYINAGDCYGTQGEIAYAIAGGKRVVSCFAPDIDPTDFWLWSIGCHAVHTNVRECCLPRLLAASVSEIAFEMEQQTQGARK